MLIADGAGGPRPAWQGLLFARTQLDLPRKPPPPQQDPPSPPAPASSAPAAAPGSAFTGVFAPGMPPLGIRQFTVQPGDTAWHFFEQAGVFDGADLRSADRLADAQLAATPGLDPRAFGTRPAALPSATRELQPGDAVNVLDATRLNLLEQQRSELHALESSASAHTDSQASHRDELHDALVTTVYQELDYAGTQQAVPQLEDLAAPIRARAPADAVFNRAVDDALALYKTNLAAQGRTDDQLGVLLRQSQSQDFAGVRDSVRSQLLALSGARDGSEALGVITGRGSVYLSYAGGDPRLAQAIQQGVHDAEQQVLVDRPAASVEQAYRAGGADAAMKRLLQVTDPAQATPGQVGQILSDARVLSVIDRSLHDVHGWHDPRGGPGLVMQNLGTACQRALYSDGGVPGPGRQAVDHVAGTMLALADGPGPDIGSSLFQSGMRLRNVFMDGAAQGQDALGLAFAAQARARGDVGLARAVEDGVRTGFDAFNGSVKDLRDKAVEDSGFLTVPAQEWGAASTPDEQAAATRALIAQNPDKARRLEQDGRDLLDLQEKLQSARAGMDAYAPGFAHLEGAQDPAAPRNGEPTNTLWFQRSLRKVVEMAGKSYIARLGQGGEPLLPPRGVQVLQTLWKRGHKSLGALLYFQNAAFELGEFGQKARSGALVNGLVNGASGLRQELAGVSYALSASIPSDKLAGIRPGSGATPLAESYAGWSARIDDLAVNDATKLTLKQGVRLVLQDTSDLASAVLGVISAGAAFHDGKPLEGVGQSLNALGYGLMLTGSGIDEAVFAGDATLLGMGSTAWTGIGAVLVLAGSAIYTGATAYSHSHQYDQASRQWLQAMGVRPEIADVLARHATVLDGQVPSAGPFLAAYFAHSGLSQQRMVQWLNLLSPQQADDMATAIKVFDDEWKRHPMQENARRFDQALLQYGLMPPDVQLVAGR